MPVERLRVLDLFSGAGGLSLGFHAEGFRTVGAVDSDEHAAKTYERMFRPVDPGFRMFGGPVDGDISKYSVEELIQALPEPPDVIIGGPPCQSFSRIGRAKQRHLRDQELEDLADDCEVDGGLRNQERAELYRDFLRAVGYARPLAFVIENVPGMVEGGGIGTDYAYRVAHEAAAMGYQVRYFLLNAVNYGVPQFRWRLFFVGFRHDLGPTAIPAPPTPTHIFRGEVGELYLPIDDPWFTKVDPAGTPRLLPAVTTFEAFGDLPVLKTHLGPGTVADRRPKEQRLPLRRAPSDYARLLRAWPDFPAADTVGGNWYRFNDRDFRLFARMAQGEKYPDALAIAFGLLEDELSRWRQQGLELHPGTPGYKEIYKAFIPPYRNDAFHDKWRKLQMDHPAWTVTAHLRHDTYSHIHYDSRQARTITIREAARLQSFPDAFEFSGNFGEQFRQIGNAVPPLLARAIAKQVLTQLVSLGAVAVPESLEWAEAS